MSGAVDVVEERARARVGDTLRDKYKLEALLGVGGTAAVYRAVHRNGNRVAIKMLHREISLDVEIRGRFLREGYAANNVGHVGVMRVLDDDTADDGSTFLVMELLDGETLDERAANNGGSLPVKDVLAAAYQLLGVLAVAHERGIIHRDVKPENLFLTQSGLLKILDFGIARVRDLASVHATMDGQVFGTPAFMPPEQALGQPSDVDHRSDLWAVGATMFTLLTGRYVYEGETATQHILQAAYSSPPPLAEVLAGVPSTVAAIVDRALLRERDGRWQSAREMRAAIDEAHTALFGVTLSSRESDPHSPSVSVLGESPTLSPPEPQRAERRPVGLIVAIAVGALVAVGGAFALWWLTTPSDVAPALAQPEPTAEVAPTIGQSAAPPPTALADAALSSTPPEPPVSANKAVPKPPRRPPRKNPGTGAFDYQ